MIGEIRAPKQTSLVEAVMEELQYDQINLIKCSRNRI